MMSRVITRECNMTDEWMRNMGPIVMNIATITNREINDTDTLCTEDCMQEHMNQCMIGSYPMIAAVMCDSGTLPA